jgi:hypothetical protein
MTSTEPPETRKDFENKVRAAHARATEALEQFGQAFKNATLTADAFRKAFMYEARPYMAKIVQDFKPLIASMMTHKTRRRTTYYRHPKRRALRK